MTSQNKTRNTVRFFVVFLAKGFNKKGSKVSRLTQNYVLERGTPLIISYICHRVGKHS